MLIYYILEAAAKAGALLAENSAKEECMSRWHSELQSILIRGLDITTKLLSKDEPSVYKYFMF